jgi:hypothetical protein
MRGGWDEPAALFYNLALKESASVAAVRFSQNPFALLSPEVLFPGSFYRRGVRLGQIWASPPALRVSHWLFLSWKSILIGLDGFQQRAATLGPARGHAENWPLQVPLGSISDRRDPDGNDTWDFAEHSW